MMSWDGGPQRPKLQRGDTVKVYHDPREKPRTRPAGTALLLKYRQRVMGTELELWYARLEQTIAPDGQMLLQELRMVDEQHVAVHPDDLLFRGGESAAVPSSAPRPAAGGTR